MVHVDRPSTSALLSVEPGEASWAVAERVAKVREMSAMRGAHSNAEMSDSLLDDVARLDEAATAMVAEALDGGRLSARGLRRLRCVARTIRDLDDGGDGLREIDISAALQLRARPPIGGDHV
jgi:magnesium chelatase family protein